MIGIPCASASQPSEAEAKRRPLQIITPAHALSCPVVGIGASAGGLGAFKALIDAMPPVTGLAFVLVQHLDPHHPSMMVDLLAGRSALSVVEATEGMPVEREHLYTIPPDRFLSVADGHLRLSRPPQRHGARFPFDFFLTGRAQCASSSPELALMAA